MADSHVDKTGEEKTMAHIMLDLETLSAASDAAIVAIGAVKFDPVSGQVFTGPESSGTFYRVINAKSAQRAGGRVDADTVMWWMKQSDAARYALTGNDSLAIETVLKEFSEWVRSSHCAGMWGNGADFDNVILQNSYHRLGWTAPWPYKMSRCYRTVKAMAPNIEFVREGVHHNALDDAVSQAHHLIKMMKKIL